MIEVWGRLKRDMQLIWGSSSLLCNFREIWYTVGETQNYGRAAVCIVAKIPWSGRCWDL